MTLKISYLRIVCAVVGLFGYFMGALSLRNYAVTGGADSELLSSNFVFAASDLKSWVYLLGNTTFFIIIVVFAGLSAVGFILVLPAVFYKMYALGFTSAMFFLIYGAKGLLYIIILLPSGFISFAILILCGGASLRFSVYILERLSIIPSKNSQYLFPENYVNFSVYIQNGVIYILLSFVLPLYEGVVMPFAFGFIK